MTINDPITAAIIGALFGALGTYIAQRKVRSKEQQRQRNNIRLALKTELESVGTLNDVDEKPLILMMIINDRTMDYSTIKGDIKHLSEDEITALLDFYGQLELLKGLFGDSVDASHINDLVKSATLPSTFDSFSIESAIEELERGRVEAINTLDENLEKS